MGGGSLNGMGTVQRFTPSVEPLTGREAGDTAGTGLRYVAGQKTGNTAVHIASQATGSATMPVAGHEPGNAAAARPAARPTRPSSWCWVWPASGRRICGAGGVATVSAGRGVSCSGGLFLGHRPRWGWNSTSCRLSVGMMRR